MGIGDGALTGTGEGALADGGGLVPNKLDAVAIAIPEGGRFAFTFTPPKVGADLGTGIGESALIGPGVADRIEAAD